MKTLKFKEQDLIDLIETFELLNYMSNDKETKKYNNRFIRKFKKALLQLLIVGVCVGIDESSK